MQLLGVKLFFQTVFPFLFTAPQAPDEGEPKFLLPETGGKYSWFYDQAVHSSCNAARVAQTIAHDHRTALSEMRVPNDGRPNALYEYERNCTELDDDANRLDGISVDLMREPRMVPADFSFKTGDHTKLFTARKYAEKEAREWEWTHIARWSDKVLSTPLHSRAWFVQQQARRVLYRLGDGRFVVAQLRTPPELDCSVCDWMTDSTASMNADELRAIVDYRKSEGQ